MEPEETPRPPIAKTAQVRITIRHADGQYAELPTLQPLEDEIQEAIHELLGEGYEATVSAEWT